MHIEDKALTARPVFVLSFAAVLAHAEPLPTGSVKSKTHLSITAIVYLAGARYHRCSIMHLPTMPACSRSFAKGFALDEMHRPHITLVQRFVRTADLDRVYAAVYEVLAKANVTAIKLEAYKYYYSPGNGVGVAGIVAGRHPC